MGVRKFLHDFIGYRGKNKELHAMLCVIEAHVRSHPEEYEQCVVEAFDKRFDNHGFRFRCLNKPGELVIRGDSDFHYPAVFIQAEKSSLPIKWEKLIITTAWRNRIDRLYQWHETWRERQKEIGLLATNKRKQEQQRQRYNEIVNRLRTPNQDSLLV